MPVVSAPLAVEVKTPARIAVSRINVHWIERWKQVDALGSAYSRFLGQLGDRAFFLERERLALLWPAHHQIAGELAWLWVERDGEGLGLAPLQLERKSLVRGGVRRLGAFGKVRGALAQWYVDWIVPVAEDRPAVLAAIHDALCGPFADRWDLLEMELLSARDATTQAWVAAWPEVRFEDDPAITAAIELNGDFESYAAKFSHKFVREVQREQRKLATLATRVEYHTSTTLDARRWAEIERIHRQRRREVTGKGIARAPLFESSLRGSIFRQYINWTASAGMARHYWLEADGEMIAFMLGTAYGETLYLQLTAMDDRFAKVSPTRLLIWHLLEREATLHGTRMVDMGVGMNLFKQQFGTRFEPMLQMRWVNPVSRIASFRCGWLDLARRCRARFNPEA